MTREKIENLKNFDEIIQTAVKSGVAVASRKFNISYGKLLYYIRTHDIKIERDYYFNNKDVMDALARRINEQNIARVAAEDGVSKQAIHQKMMNAGFTLIYVRKQDVKDLPYVREIVNE